MNLLLLLPVVAALAGESHSHQSLISFGKDVVVSTRTTVQEVVSVGGSVTIDGIVEDGVVAVGGPARVNGSIGDDLVIIGSGSLGPKAVVNGELVVVGGSVDIAPGARIKGNRTSVSFSGVMKDHPEWAAPLSRASGWLHEGPMKLRLIDPARPWAWGLALALLLGYVLLALAAPAPVEACAAVLASQPVQALAVGVLLLSFLGPVSLVFVVTVFGIALLPVVAALVLAGGWLGKAGAMRLLGGRLTGGAAPLPAAVALGGLLLTLAYAVPAIGLPLWGLIGAWGLGAAALAAFEAARTETARVASSTAVASSAAPSAPSAIIVAEGSLPRAGFWLRLGATAIDVVAVAVLAGLAPFVSFGLGIWAVYQIALWTWKGTTLGGIVVGVRGVRLDGRPMDLTVAAVRHLASYFSAFAAFIGFFWAAWDAEGQTWHDKIAGTVVVRVPRAEPLI